MRGIFQESRRVAFNVWNACGRGTSGNARGHGVILGSCLRPGKIHLAVRGAHRGLIR
jgi:hypothetical protein